MLWLVGHLFRVMFCNKSPWAKNRLCRLDAGFEGASGKRQMPRNRQHVIDRHVITSVADDLIYDWTYIDHSSDRSLSASMCVCVCISVCVSVRVSVCVCLFWSLCMYLYVFLCMCVPPSLWLRSTPCLLLFSLLKTVVTRYPDQCLRLHNHHMHLYSYHVTVCFPEFIWLHPFKITCLYVSPCSPCPAAPFSNLTPPI